MASTQVRGKQIKDNDVGREDINIATTGRAVVRKLIQGTGITLSSTGVDAGTGDVTITLGSHTHPISALTDHTKAAHQTLGLTSKRFGVTVSLGDSINVITGAPYWVGKLPYDITGVSWYAWVLDSTSTTIVVSYWNGSAWTTIITASVTAYVLSGTYTGTLAVDTLIKVQVTVPGTSKFVSFNWVFDKGE